MWELCEAARPVVTLAATHLGHNNDDDAILAAESALWEAACRWRGEGGATFSHYAYVVARRAIVRHTHRVRRVQYISEYPQRRRDTQYLTTATTDLDQCELLDLQSAICQLDELGRMVMALRYWRGLSNAEVGDRLGVSTSDARRLCMTALAELRSKMGVCYDE